LLRTLREGNRSIRSAELGLALLVISVVAMMIVPLPTWLLDVLNW
jgi:type III secretory pathway component EscV